MLVLVGFLITIIALTPGARFWFDLLGKLGSLRSTGPKPAELMAGRPGKGGMARPPHGHICLAMSWPRGLGGGG